MGSGFQPTFFDACSGIGCFHLGMKKAGFKCIGAAEIDEGLQLRYPKAFKISKNAMFGSVADLINNEKWRERRNMKKDPMKNAILTAGFPCQPFSKAGAQEGENHEEGNVFEHLVSIIVDLKSPAFIFENVENLIGEI